MWGKLSLAVFLCIGMVFAEENKGGGMIKLPVPNTMSVEEAIAKRRSVRVYKKGPLKLAEVSQLLWTGQGITDRMRGFRAAPSAGATYPLTLYLVVGEVEELETGVYKYLPELHALVQIKEGDVRKELARASLGQGMIAKAPASVVIAANYERTTARYGRRGIRYVHIEVGHVGENVYLQAEAMGLGTVAVGAFDDAGVARVLGIGKGEEVLYIMPVGRK